MWRNVCKGDGRGISVLCLPGREMRKERTVLKSSRQSDLLYQVRVGEEGWEV